MKAPHRESGTVRGGDTNGPHTHRDLLSWHCTVGDEHLVVNLSPDGYLDTTFSRRRDDLFEMRPESKNTILVNGVGVVLGAKLKPARTLLFPAGEGILLDASDAYGEMRDDRVVTFCGRLVVLLRKGRGILIVDRAELPHPGQAETRFHALGEVRPTRAGAIIRGERQTLRAAFAADVDSMVVTGVTSPTNPTGQSATVVRYASRDRTHTRMTFATLLTPGRRASALTLEADEKEISVNCGGQGWNAVIETTARLRLRSKR